MGKLFQDFQFKVLIVFLQIEKYLTLNSSTELSSFMNSWNQFYFKCTWYKISTDFSAYGYFV